MVVPEKRVKARFNEDPFTHSSARMSNRLKLTGTTLRGTDGRPSFVQYTTTPPALQRSSGCGDRVCVREDPISRIKALDGSDHSRYAPHFVNVSGVGTIGM